MISVEQIARLADLYDRYNNALDPLSEDSRQAKRLFDELVNNLHLGLFTLFPLAQPAGVRIVDLAEKATNSRPKGTNVNSPISIQPTHQNVRFLDFRYELIQRCREYMRKN